MREVMLKGANVAVRLYIEGYDEPAHDFAQLAREVTLRVLELGIAAYQKEGPLHIQPTGIRMLEGGAGEEEEDLYEPIAPAENTPPGVVPEGGAS